MKGANAAQTTKMKKYLMLCKKECWPRLAEILFNEKTGPLDCKYWLAMGKTPFMGAKFVDKKYAM